MIIWEGPSELDGSPIVAIATGLDARSRNRKTGPMPQVWILARDVHPVEAIRTGADASICGDCPLRGYMGKGRTCYVNVGMAPAAVWRSYKAGNYGTYEPGAAHYGAVAVAFSGQTVRLGAYGDPAAVPLSVWLNLTRYARAWTGYTHQWRTANPGLALFCMASVENEHDAQAARIRGYRTFRIKQASDPVRHKEIVCPASAEAGRKTTCSKCLACGGTSAKANAHVVINVH